MGSIQNPSENIVTPPSLVNGTTYYFGIGGDASLIKSIYLKWDASIIATITFEDTNFDDVALTSTTAGDWTQENPTGGYVGGSGAGGMTATGLTLVIAGGTAGGSMVHLGNMGGKRLRMKVVVGGTGGVLRARPHGVA